MRWQETTPRSFASSHCGNHYCLMRLGLSRTNFFAYALFLVKYSLNYKLYFVYNLFFKFMFAGLGFLNFSLMSFLHFRFRFHQRYLLLSVKN